MEIYGEMSPKKLYIVFLATFAWYTSGAKVRIMGVDPVNGIVALRNFYTTPVRLAQYMLSWNQSDSMVANMEIISGDTLLAPKAFVFVRIRGLSYSDGYIALHDLRYNQKFGSVQAMADYMQWGNSGHRFEGLADSSYTIAFNSSTMQNDTTRKWIKGSYIVSKPPYNFFGGSVDYGYQFWQSYKLPQLGLKLVTIVPSENRLVIKNTGASATDISGLNICTDSGCVDSASKLRVVYGSLNINKNDSVILEGMPMNDSIGSVSLFFPLNVKDTTNIIDFVQWGGGGQIYSRVAHLRGLNDSTQYIKSNQKDTLYYIGNFSASQFGASYWIAWHYNDSALEDTVKQDTTGIAVLSPFENIKIYPNPSEGHIFISDIPNNPGKAWIRVGSLSGSWIYSQRVNSSFMPLSLNYLSAGLYILQVISEDGNFKNTIINIQ